MKNFLRGLLHLGARRQNLAPEEPSPLKRPAHRARAEQPITVGPPTPLRPTARAGLHAEPYTPSEPVVPVEPAVAREPKLHG
jgi:hypothetical protein